MINPKKQLQKQLEQFVFNILFIKGLIKELKILEEWIKNQQFEALNVGSTFFNLVIRNFTNSLYIELNKLLNKKEDKNLFEWLTKAKEHRKNLVSQLQQNEFENKITQQVESLNKIDEKINNIIGLRDKIVAHIDTKYFYDIVKAYDDYPVNPKSIEEVLLLITEILQYHCHILIGSHVEIELHSSSNVDSILKYVRAFDRVRKDEKIIELGVSPYLYKLDNYPGSGIKKDISESP